MIGHDVVTVGSKALTEAQDRVAACQNCSSSASRPFRSVLHEVLGFVHPAAEFVVAEPVACPNCGNSLVENTLVRCEGELEMDSQTTAAMYPAAFSLDETNVVLINDLQLGEAASWITGCQKCTSGAQMTFEYILDAVTESEDPASEYVIRHPVACPRCHSSITEKTLIVVN